MMERYIVAAILILLKSAASWTNVLRKASRAKSSITRRSTPFEADLYDKNPYESNLQSSLSVSEDTKLVVGLNKYSHDTSICAADAKTGDILFATSKERLTRRKHDSGNVVGLVEYCLEALNLQLENIEGVVMNNHHHRIQPLEANVAHMQWELGLAINGGVEDGYDEPENLLPDAKHRHELSHHLAHAYSAAAQAPFESGLCVIMDGMGETFRTMQRSLGDVNYTSDLSFGIDTFQCVPSNIAEQAASCYFDWREAESVYTFTKTEQSIDLKPIFKRFTRENSPPTLYNHGFENMDSVGALYSRASSHIFGDWNACGKVMGLAPWANYEWSDGDGNKISPKLHDRPIIVGSLYSEDQNNKLKIDRSLMEGLPHIARNDADLFDIDGTPKRRYDFDDNEESDLDSEQRKPSTVALDAISLAHRIQVDTEKVVLDFVRHFKSQTGQSNLCLAGGVALNSVLNGRLARELGFEQTFVPPYPGDDGIAVGCCAFGLFGNKNLETEFLDIKPSVWEKPHSPYSGAVPSESLIKEAIEDAAPWLEVESIRNEDQRLQIMVEEISSGAVVAWYQSRSEMGPRALGHRSILADPRKKGLVRFINERVKSRESFRPFAPSVLAEEAKDWFDLGEYLPNDSNVSPYMSMTALVHKEKRAIIPAVTHVDGSSRLQTVTKEAEPAYHKLISMFLKLTGVPMVLNTSFNTLPSEPIVETPSDAIRSFLYSMGSIETLVMGDYVIKRKQPDLRKLLGEMSKEGDARVEPLCPQRSGAVNFQTTFDLEADNNENDEVETVTKVRMPDRPMHGNKNEWFELLDELEGEILSVCDGTSTLNEIMAQYSAVPEGSSASKEDMEATQNLLQNIVRRMVRLFEHTLIYW